MLHRPNIKSNCSTNFTLQQAPSVHASLACTRRSRARYGVVRMHIIASARLCSRQLAGLFGRSQGTGQRLAGQVSFARYGVRDQCVWLFKIAAVLILPWAVVMLIFAVSGLRSNIIPPAPVDPGSWHLQCTYSDELQSSLQVRSAHFLICAQVWELASLLLKGPCFHHCLNYRREIGQ